MSTDEERSDLIHKTVMSRFELLFIDKFKQLQLKDQDDRRLQNECAYWMATIYYNNERWEEALSILRKLVGDREMIHGEFSNILDQTLKALTKLNMLDEARELFSKNARSTLLNSISRISLLSWYVETFNPDDTSLIEYLDIFEDSRKELEIVSAEVGLKAQIQNVHDINKKVAKIYGQILISFKGKDADEKIRMVNAFIASDPPGFYKKQAVSMLLTLESE